MATRCGCSGQTCSCAVKGDGVTTSVSGVGSAANPYIVTALSQATYNDTATVNLTETGTAVTADVNISAQVGNELVANADGLYVPTVTPCISTDAGNTLSFGADGCLYAPVAGAGAVNVGCGLSGDGSAGNPLKIGKIASAGENIQFGATFPALPLANDNTRHLAQTANVSIPNPSSCAPAQIFGYYEWDTQVDIPANVGVEMAIGDSTANGALATGDGMWYAENRGNATEFAQHWQLGRGFSDVIPAGGTYAFSSNVFLLGNGPGATFDRIQFRAHWMVVVSN